MVALLGLSGGHRVCAGAGRCARPLLRCLTLDSWSSSSASAQRRPVPSVPSSQEECTHMYYSMYVHGRQDNSNPSSPKAGGDASAGAFLQKPCRR